MSKLGQLRKKVHYQTSVPRCVTCAHYKKAFVFLTENSLTQRAKPSCKLHFFNVDNNARCKDWTAQVTTPPNRPTAQGAGDL